MFVYRDSVLMTHPAENRPHGTLIGAGVSVSIGEYWPVKDDPGFTRPAIAFPGKWIGEDKPANYGDDFDAMYNAILANPLDASPRMVFADWLEERITQSRYSGWPESFRGFKGGEYPVVNHPITVSRWDGPGRIYRGEYGTWDTWIGVSGQFMQSCRSGLFTSNPITTCIVWDLMPQQSHIYGSYFMVEQGDSSAQASNTETYYRIALNDLCGHFMSQHSFMPRDPEIRGYRAINCNLALRGVSCAYVDLGRYAAGLPQIEWPQEEVKPETESNLEASWYLFACYENLLYDQNVLIATGRKCLRSLIARE